MDKISISIKDTDLSSRKTAAAVRQQILEATNKGKVVSIDLSKTLSVSESYADEAFGVLVAYRGLDWLFENVQIHSTNDSVLSSIAHAIHRRSNESKITKAVHICQSL